MRTEEEIQEQLERAGFVSLTEEESAMVLRGEMTLGREKESSTDLIALIVFAILLSAVWFSLGFFCGKAIS